MMVRVQDVMVFVPYGPRLEPETVQAVLDLQWDGAITHVFQQDNPYDGKDNGRQNILHQYQRGRALFLQGTWDAMLVVESDIVPPADALQRLASVVDDWGADVAYGVYRFRTTNVVNIFERYNVPQPKNPGESLSLHPKKLAEAIVRGVIRCSGAGLGCVLITRPVLAAIEFRMERTAHCDTYFTVDVLRDERFEQMADMRVVCGHIDEAGALLWPDLPELVRV